MVLDTGGVGYELHIPLSTFAALPDTGKTLSLHVHTHAREGALQLFGFATSAERTAFELLLRASRVGPKLAQTVLSGISPERLLAAIRDVDAAPLETGGSSGPNVAVIVAGAAAVAVALGGAGWYARRRRGRRASTGPAARTKEAGV